MGNVVANSFWTAPQPVSRSEMITKVVQVYGNVGDDDLEGAAGGFLDDAVDDLNMYLWEFTRVKETNLTFTADQEYVQINQPFYRESIAYLSKIVDTTKTNSALIYVPWIHFERLRSVAAPSGTPDKYSLRNVERDGRVYFMPFPDARCAASFYLNIEYYQRILRPSEQDPLHVPREIINAIIYSAQKRFAIMVYGAAHPDVASFASLEHQAVERLRAIDKRHPDEQIRFKIVDNNSDPMSKTKTRFPIYTEIA